MYIAILSFWLTYFIIGKYLNHTENIKTTRHGEQILTQHTINIIYIINIITSFAFIPLLSYIPILIHLPNHPMCYICRWVMSFILSDIWLYFTHRLMHAKFYHYHKIHHYYVNPSAFAGLVTHPFEFILSNYLSMMLPLITISHHELMVFETAFVAIDILFSHCGTTSRHPSAIYHILHHQLQNCNYGFLYFTDMIFGTYVS